EEAPFLTIAKVQGHALGAGMQLALACDVRIAADDCQMGLLETRWGLMPDLGGTVWLPRIVGPSRALEMIATAARLRADELLALGIVNRVVARDTLDATVDEFVAQVVAQPPLAVRGAKAAIREGWGRPTVDGMRAAAVAQLPCLSSSDFREAGRAFLEQRPAVYTGH
ncbi:MAG TPA: enoyl-CoA hydratase-related protein, partial [Acidimicrobiia bacterium]